MRTDKSPLSWLLRPAVVTLLLIGYCSTREVGATEQNASETPFDVIHYDTQLEPDIAQKTITGTVLIRLRANTDNLASITLDCGELLIDVVEPIKQKAFDSGLAYSRCQTDRIRQPIALHHEQTMPICTSQHQRFRRPH
jgi:hypothetical protein